MKIVGWDISHMEFTIEDHYYFSILQKVLRENNISVKIIKKLDEEELDGIDILVFNYPEKPFTPNEVELVKKFMLNGGTVIVAGYYENEDNIADTINSLTSEFGLKLEKDAVVDEVNNYNNDNLFVVTSKIYGFNEGVSKVMMACAAPITIINNKSSKVIIEGEETSKTKTGVKPILAAEQEVGKGRIILLGTCVFWDNYSIEKYNNLQFSINLLTGKT